MADSALAMLTLTQVQIYIGAFGVIGLLASLHYSRKATQAAIEATRIAQASTDIALAALDRPYILIESMTYRCEAGQGEFLLSYFDFTIQNYGNSPAIIHKIVAHGFLSSGQRGAKATDSYPTVSFPEPGDFPILLGDRQSVRVFPEAREGVVSLDPLKIGYKHRLSTLVIRPGETAPLFSHFVKDIWLMAPDYEREGERQVFSNAAPWLLGEITYSSILGRNHYTRFCFRARSDGVAEEKGGAPYNERT